VGIECLVASACKLCLTIDIRHSRQPYKSIGLPMHASHHVG